MTSLAVLGLEVRSEQVRQADASLDDLAESATRAEAATQQLTRAQDGTEAQMRETTQAVQAQKMAQDALTASSRAVAFRQRMLAVQSLDVAQSLALGMNPMMVAVQQGGQIAGIYAGQGGVSGAFREAASSVLGFARAHPVALAATAALGLGALGLKNELEAASGQSVSFGQVFTATMQELLASVNGIAAPAIALLGRAFNVVANSIFDALSLVGNSIINTFEFAYRAVIAIWDNLPEALGDLAFSAVQGIADAINPILSLVNLPELNVNNPFAGSASAMGEAMGAAYSVFENDRISDFIGNVATRLQTMTATADEAAGSLGRAAQAATDAEQPMDLLGESVQAANDNFEAGRSIFNSFFSDLRSQIQQGASVWDAFKSAGLDALNSILSKVVEMASNNLFMGLFGSGGTSSGGGGLLSGLFGSFSGFFANGGSIGAGSWGIVGEGGGMEHAEAVSGPATVTPLRDMFPANNNQPQPVTINQNVTVSGTVGLPEIGLAIAEANRTTLSQVDGRAVRAVTNVNRTKPGLIG